MISHTRLIFLIWPFVKWLDGICLKVLIQNVSHTLTVIWPVVKWLIVSRRVFPGFFIFYIFFIYNVSFLRVSHSTSEPVIWSVIGFGYANIQIYKYTNVQITITIFRLIRYNGSLLRISHSTSEPVIWPVITIWHLQMIVMVIPRSETNIAEPSIPDVR